LRRTFCVKVYGCQMNVYDGDRLRSAMTGMGWEESDNPGDSDFVIFVTCSIRDKAEQKVISELGRFRPLWEKNSRPGVALVGCMAQRSGLDLAKKFPWVRIIAGPRSLGLVPSSIASLARSSGAPVVHLDDDPTGLRDLSCAPARRGNRHKAYITIAHGCDQFCSYCIVPYVRGRFISRAPDEILDEAARLVGDGAVELTLLGQNVNSYGRDLPSLSSGGGSACAFAGLLSDVASISGLRRLRFTTSHPVDFTDDILEVMRAHANICPSINLPVQAGSDKVLSEMNRKYTKVQYMRTVTKIRDALPELGLTSDLIVGFPGETEEDFEESMSALAEIRFDLVHTAAYSERAGTPAATMPGALPQEVRMERLNRVNKLQDGITLSINKGLIGRRCRVLTEGPAPKGEGLLQGRTPTDKVVLLPGDESLHGSFVTAEITEAESWCLRGKIIP